MKYGFYELSKEYRKDMSEFYRDEYYQEEHGLYKCVEYDKLDVDLRNKKQDVKNYIFHKYHKVNVDNPKLLDIGAGEGYVMDYFDKKGWGVTGIDYSSFGMKAHNPHVLDKLMVGDFNALIDECVEGKRTFDFINADNLLEHLSEPEEIFRK